MDKEAADYWILKWLAETEFSIPEPESGDEESKGNDCKRRGGVR